MLSLSFVLFCRDIRGCERILRFENLVDSRVHIFEFVSSTDLDIVFNGLFCLVHECGLSSNNGNNADGLMILESVISELHNEFWEEYESSNHQDTKEEEEDFFIHTPPT